MHLSGKALGIQLDTIPEPQARTPVRVAFIGMRGLPADLPKAGGGERETEEKAVRLSRLGYDVTVYCRWHYNRRPSSPYKGVRLISLPSLPTKSLDTVTHSLLATLHVAFARTADIISYHGMGNALFVPLARLLGKRTVVYMDGADWSRPKWGPVARSALRSAAWLAFKLADSVYVDNVASQRQLGELFGRLPEVITLAAESWEDPGCGALATFSLDPGEYVLFVGLLKPDKGVHVLIDAYKSVQTQVPLVIVGDSPDAGSYVRHLRSTEDSRVRFLGYVYGAEAQQLFANARLYVQPSLVEGNSPALLNAMAYGRCVVVSDIEENAETVGDAGFTFVSGDSNSLAQKLTDLLDDAGVIESMGVRARQRVETVYTWETVISQLDRLYRSLSAPANAAMR